jgi:uncharacterized protein YpmS
MLTINYLLALIFNYFMCQFYHSPAPVADSEEEKTAKKVLAKALLERTMAVYLHTIPYSYHHIISVKPFAQSHVVVVFNKAVENAWKFQKDAPEMGSSRQGTSFPTYTL